MQIYSEYRETNPKVSLSVDLNDELINLNEVDFDIALRITSHPPKTLRYEKFVILIGYTVGAVLISNDMVFLNLLPILHHTIV